MSVTLNVAPLRRLQAQFALMGASRVHVGLFANTASRVNRRSGIDHNPSLGAVHEFGASFSRKGTGSTTTIPRRSFLEMPLSLYLGSELLRSGANWIELIATRGLPYALARLGLVGEDVVQEAFATGGFGNWPALAPETIRRKGSSAILIESAQMRKAISSRVV